MALFGREAINKHEWRGTVGYRFHSSRKGMKSINKSIWYIDIQVLVSRKAEFPYSSLPDHLSFPSIYAKIPFHSSLRTLRAKCSSVLFPAATIRSLPFQSMLDGMYVCVNMHSGPLYPKSAPTKSQLQIITMKLKFPMQFSSARGQCRSLLVGSGRASRQ